MKLTLATAIGCGTFLIASLSSLPANAADSGTIRATGTIPASCSVVGNEGIVMTQNGPDGPILAGRGDVHLEGNASNVSFNLHYVEMSLPDGVADPYQHVGYIGLYDPQTGAQIALADTNGTGDGFWPQAPYNKTLQARAGVILPQGVTTYAPGTYQVWVTLDCTIQ